MSREPRRLLGPGLRSRIIRTTALASALAMGAMIATVVIALNAATASNIRSTLTDRFETTRSAVATPSADPAQALQTSVDAIEESTWLFDGTGTLIEGPRSGRRVQALAARLGRVTERTRVTRHERVYLAGPVTIGGGSRPGPGVLVVSESLEPYESTRTELLVGLVALGLLVTAGASAIAAWTMSRTLAPVEAMAELAQDWSERELDARFDDRGAENEIAHLGRTLNVLLDRVAGALRGEQRLTSELAHELRTPLSGIRGEAELMRMAAVDPDAARRLDQVVSLVDQMSATISTLLGIARGEQDQAATRSSVEAVLSRTLASLAGGVRAVEIRRPEEVADELRVAATTETAVRALAPLVENAIQHAAGVVTLAVVSLPRTVAITVADDGPGVPVGDRDAARLFAAGSRSSQSQGAGLGLALSRRVARTLGGEVTVTSWHSPTSFTLTLPRP